MIYIVGTLITLFFAYFIKPEINIANKSIKRFVAVNTGKAGNIIFKFLCFLPLFLISAFRFGVGTDFFNTHYYGFQRVLSGNNFDNFEVGYRLLIKVLGHLTTNPQILFIVTSLIFVGLVWTAIYQQSPDIVFSIFLLVITRYYFISLNGVRQFLGMSIIIYSLKYIYSKKYIKYLIFNIIAILFHSSMVFCLIFLFIDKIKINKKTLIAYSIVIIVLLLSLHSNSVINYLGLLFNSNQKYEDYLSKNILLSGRLFNIYTISLNAFLLLIFLFAKRYQSNDRYYQIYFNIQAITFLVCLLLLKIPLAERIYWIFGFFQILSVPYIFDLINNNVLRITLKTLISVILLIYCIQDIFINGDHQVLPYYSVFSYWHNIY